MERVLMLLEYMTQTLSLMQIYFMRRPIAMAIELIVLWLQA